MDDQYSEDNSDAEDEDTNRHIRVDNPSSDNQHSKSKAELIIGNNKDNTESLSLGNIENMSDEGESNTYTTDGCREILAKFCVIAKKLRYSPNSKIEFVQICREKECPTTHTIERDQKTGTLAGLGEADAAKGGNCLTDPLDIWLAEALILNDNKPVNPLKWWLQQKRIGNTHGGLLQMALDVLSCPGGYTSSTLTLACGTAGTSGKYRRHQLIDSSSPSKECPSGPGYLFTLRYLAVFSPKTNTQHFIQNFLVV
ncbi:hypothetical protein PCASD_00533 [Puccinia coronata f. sp. avenae]|uniref:HAT C-terminal dimerisation domain-containing protein n=1 Tax=Puccinia coronata f. sp. avenae TaxID=200324 RepID=A0A2N5VNV1_9BASI|nr:hypothetical protein PCASD_00533 [Puccinia coronata f. sp. avenae]